MAIDSLGKLSSEQMMALSMMGNGQVTNDSNSTNSTGDETNLAFELMMKNLIDSKNKTDAKVNSEAVESSNTASANSTTNGAVNATKNSESKSGFSGTINENNNENNNVAKAMEQCPAGQNLEDLPMILTSGYVMPTRAASRSITSNRSDVDMQKIQAAASAAAKKYGVDENLILAVIKQESDFNPSVTSGCGAAGLMQIMPENFSSTGITDAYDVNQNVDGGTKLLKGYLDQYNGNMEMALMAYNGGPGTMQRRGVSSASDLYKMPQETQNYVPKVMGYYRSGV